MGSACSFDKRVMKEDQPILFHQTKNNVDDNKEGQSFSKFPKMIYFSVQPFLKLCPENFVRKMSCKITSEYKLSSKALGKGGFGEVRKGIHKASGIKRAIKMVHKTDLKDEEKDRLIDEVETLKNLVIYLFRIKN